MQFYDTKYLAIVLFLLLTIVGQSHQGIAAPSRLPLVTSDMEKPEFWVEKIKNPTNPLLTSVEVERMNEENLNKKDLRLCRIKDLRENWTGNEILSLLNEDWESFVRVDLGRGESESRSGKSFLNELRNKVNRKAIRESNRMLLGLVVKRTDIRVFPTDDPWPHDHGFDRFQHSSVSPGSPVGIYHFNQDKEWAYVQTQVIRGWVRTGHLAVAQEKSEVADYEGAKDRLVVTGNFIHVFADSSFQQSLFLSQMGDSFPLLGIPGGMKTRNPCYMISVPRRGADGNLIFRKGYIRQDEDVHQGFLSYTQANLGRQAFKMLHHPYGWGDKLGGRDCSRLIMDLFRTFGILMPRNSKEQAKVGKDLGPTMGKSIKEKGKILDEAIPLATILGLPGHIMLYLGRDEGRYYVLHSLWDAQGAEKIGTIGRVVVSDLSLGSQGPNGSLLDRITDIRTIELSSPFQKKTQKR